MMMITKLVLVVVQVYRGLDVGSAKPSPSERKVTNLCLCLCLRLLPLYSIE